MNKTAKVAIAITVGAGAYALYKFTGVSEFITVDNLRSIVDEAGPFGAAVFIAIYFLVTLFFISAAAFSLAAGALFGPLLGSIYVVVAATASAQVAFHIARYIGKDVTDKLGKHGGVVEKLISKIDEGVEKNGLKFFFVMRCLFVPYIPASYAAGLVKEAKAMDFFLGTLFANMIFSPAFVYFGDSLLKGPKALILPACLIILVLLVPKIVKKFKA